jgi:hypothetical protein
VNNDLVRYGLAAAVLWYVFAGPAAVPTGPSSGPYTGTMSALHTAAASMEPHDKAVLSEALSASGEMLAGDVQGLVSTTEELQRYIKAVTEFDYIGIGKPTAKYPAVASAVQSELTKVIGTDVAPVTPAMRSAVSAALTEAGKAVR